MKRKQKIKKDNERFEDENEYYEQQSEKKYRSLKKIKRDKPPHKKWND